MNVGTKARRRRPVYVESRLQAPLGRVWGRHATARSRPVLGRPLREHQIPAPVNGEPQRFTYAATVAPGLTIAGTGESLGDRDRACGTRWSGLKAILKVAGLDTEHREANRIRYALGVIPYRAGGPHLR